MSWTRLALALALALALSACGPRSRSSGAAPAPRALPELVYVDTPEWERERVREAFVSCCEAWRQLEGADLPRSVRVVEVVENLPAPNAVGLAFVSAPGVRAYGEREGVVVVWRDGLSELGALYHELAHCSLADAGDPDAAHADPRWVAWKEHADARLTALRRSRSGNP